MSKKISIPVFIVAILFAAIVTFQVTFLAVSQMYRNEIAEITDENKREDWENKLDYLDELTKKYFLNEISEDALSDYLPEAYIEALRDEYSYYMTKEEYEEMVKDNNADYHGIGVSVMFDSEKKMIEIVRIAGDSPALESGVRVGDFIYSIEGKNVADIGYNESLELMKGEVDTVLNFSVERKNGENYDKIDFSVKRKQLVEETVLYELINGNIGKIRILGFDGKTSEQFKNALDRLSEQGAERFVFDIRDNHGGTLDAVTKVLDMLLPKGTIMRIQDRTGKETVIESDENEITYPMVVITNGSTASAAEIFAAALRDYNKAQIVGEKTYGKGKMQSIFKLNDGSAVCITTQTYCPPYSDSYDGVGILPDKEVKLPDEFANVSLYKLAFEQDTQLQAAVDMIK